MGSFVKLFGKTSTSKVHLRVYSGGNFETQNRKTKYEGVLNLYPEVYNLNYEKLVKIIEVELNCGEGVELWYKRHGLSLFVGRKRILSDDDIENLLKTRDISNYVNVYVLKKQKEGPTASNATSLSQQTTFANPTFTLHKNRSTNTSNEPPLSTTRPSKLPTLRCKNPSFTTPKLQSKGKKAVHCFDEEDSDEEYVGSEESGEEFSEEGGEECAEESGEEGGEERAGDGVILSEGDSDYDVDDDFADELDVGESVRQTVDKGLRVLCLTGTATEENDTDFDEEEDGGF